jgi:acetylornithine deacetylase
MAPNAQSVLEFIDKETVKKLLVDLIDISSPTGEEAAMAAYLHDRFQSAGLKSFLQEADAGRYNVVGMLEGDGTGLSLMFNGHLDTTFTGKEKVGLKSGSGLTPTSSLAAKAFVDGDRIYGLGSTNMKGGLAAFVTAAEAIHKAGFRLKGDLIVAGVIGEIIMAPVDEYQEAKLRGYTRGTHYLVTHGVTADMAVVAEPTGCRIMLGHLGPQWVKISTYGVSVNTVEADKMISPFDRMLRVMIALKQWMPAYQEKMIKRYPDMKTRPALRIGALHGGTPWRLARPAGLCSVYLDIRTKQPLPELKRELKRLLNGLKEEVRNEDPDFEADVDFYLSQPGAEVPENHELVRAIENAHAEVNQAPALKYHSAIDSDASVLTHFGIPAVNYGPRPLDTSTRIGAREYQNVNDVVNAAKVFALSAIDICNRAAT